MKAQRVHGMAVGHCCGKRQCKQRGWLGYIFVYAVVPGGVDEGQEMGVVDHECGGSESVSLAGVKCSLQGVGPYGVKQHHAGFFDNTVCLRWQCGVEGIQQVAPWR